MDPPRRSVTRRQVSQSTKNLRKLDPKPSVSSDPLKSSATPSETLITKPNNFKALPERYKILDRFFRSLQCASYLGDIGLIQFKDLNAEKSPFQRTYAGQIKRCGEMARKPRYFKDQMSKAGLTPTQRTES